MITCEFQRSSGNIRAVAAKGHSDYDEQGMDIVCAAISTLMISAVNGLTEVVKLDIQYAIDDEGFIQFNIPELFEEKLLLQTNAILETLYLGVKSIESEYKNFIKVIG
ncbi:MAG: ribosomal-processing cysteine protease Prp [Eubacteriales bacterium]